MESPTEVVEGSDEEMAVVSPLEALKQLVQQTRAVKREAEVVHRKEDDAGCPDEMIQSELKKLKYKFLQELKMPWEKGFAGLVLQQGSQVMKAPFMDKNNTKAWAVEHADVEMKKAEEKVSELDIQASFKKSDRVRRPWAQSEADDRQKALAGWMAIIDEARKVCKASSMLDQCGETVLDDIFARKKNGTLQVRLSAMMMYVRWARSKGPDAFPLTKEQCYAYVDGLRKDGAPATRAASFRSALAFCKGTLQLEGVDDVLESARIIGSSHRSYLTKRVLKQRDALTVSQVSTLEYVLEGRGYPMQDRLFAGHCLLCVYGRLRMGDSQGIETEPQVLHGYLEGGTATHKTDGLRGRARRVLPVVAPAVGVTGLSWAEEFLKLRPLAGLKGNRWGMEQGQTVHH